MKKIITCLLLTIHVLFAYGQATSIVQNFDAACNVGIGFPPDWLSYNPVPGTIPDGEWTCAPENGRYSTNGIKCTGVWGTPSAYHLDTAYLISPSLDLSGDTGHIYLHFDTKVSNVNLGARLSMMVTYDTIVSVFSDRTDSLAPLFSNDDSTDWVTHIADLTPFKSFHPLYVAFRYTSGTTTGSTWYLDNIYTTSTPTGIPKPAKESIAINVVGNSTSSSITLSWKTASPGLYHLSIYDLTGSEVHKETIFLSDNSNTYTVGGLSLNPGMYLVKLGNGVAYSTAKAVVQ